MSFPRSCKNGKPEPLYVNICEQNCSKRNCLAGITGLWLGIYNLVFQSTLYDEVYLLYQKNWILFKAEECYDSSGVKIYFSPAFC